MLADNLNPLLAGQDAIPAQLASSDSCKGVVSTDPVERGQNEAFAFPPEMTSNRPTWNRNLSSDPTNPAASLSELDTERVAVVKTFAQMSTKA
ncbi:unnamed protein product [Protopolystoma xenopodis]|uniref:Uncharacterized protein n=1 Tax=Protopolystoma xenopodis TaxID=117903 RepID=A0A448XPT0_9PLAT|nr:unnamed protein product [Protopolystoma xenopodis]